MKCYQQHTFIFLLFLVTLSTGCSKLIEIGPPKNQLTTEVVFADSTSAVAALSNMYYTIGNQIYASLNRGVGIYTDEETYTLSNQNQVEFFQNSLDPSNTSNLQIWNNLYFVIYSCNELLEQVADIPTLAETTKSRLVGEARFLRAYSYFILQNLYGNIPLILQTDVNINRQAPQASPGLVYQTILEDLRAAKDALSEQYPSDGKVKANKWAAAAMLSRVSLYLGNWQEAEEETTFVIGSGMYTLIGSVDGSFLAHSQEAILQLWTENGFVSDANSLIPNSTTAVPQYIITDVLSEAFEDGDLRHLHWVGYNTSTTDGISTSYPYPYKYKNSQANATQPEYLMVLRLAEQYLIRSEARARQGDIGGAIADLNIIRERAGLPLLDPVMDLAACLAAIMQERRVELFSEWGHRFFDLKRTGQLNSVMEEYKSTWREKAVVFPIPQNELTYNNNLVQNEGYD